jgi:beta-glucosidase-like glycosyl hydrolase
MVGKMTLVEKVNVTTGVGWAQGLCVGNTAPAVHVGFPSLCLQDGPLGLRFVDHATAWPAALTVGATFNRELAFKRGAGHGEEARKKGINVLLGPSMGPLGRMPGGGRFASHEPPPRLVTDGGHRNWEGFGTDPYLQGVQAAQTIKGIQSSGVIATAKHFILNEQEHFRQIVCPALHRFVLIPYPSIARVG